MVKINLKPHFKIVKIINMTDFRIISPSSEPIIISQQLPGTFQKYHLKGATGFLASGLFGDMLFYHFKGNGFDIWKSDYLMKIPSKFSGQADQSVLELHIPFINDFKTSWEGLDHCTLKNKQYEVSYVPFVNTKASFEGGIHYETFDIHLSKEMLYPYADFCPQLDKFLEYVEKKQPRNLLDRVQFLSPCMVTLICDLLNYRFREELAERYYKSCVEELLVLITEQLTAFNQMPAFSFAAIHKAEEARKIIHADFECYHTVEQLAKMTGTTESSLQLAFKNLYGTTVSKYSRKVRLAYGYKLLTETNYPLRVVCVMSGYPDPANFSVAFRKQHGFWPGYIQKRKAHS